MNLKNMILLFFIQTYQKRKRFHKRKCHVAMSKKWKKLPIWKCHVTKTKKYAYIIKEMQLQNQSLTFIRKNKSLFSSYQHSISFTHGLQHYRLLEQAELYRLCGLWQMSRQILTILLVQNWFQLLRIKTRGIQEKWQQIVATDPKPFNGRSRF